MYRPIPHPLIRKNRNMCCHGNHAFSHSPNHSLFLRIFFIRIQGVPGNNLASMKNCPRGARWVKLDTGIQRHIEYIEIAFCILAWSIFSHGINGSYQKHEKWVIRILNLKIIYQIMIFSFDKLRKCYDYKR